MSRRSSASIYRYAGDIPTDESFNGKFRDECLSLQWFRNRIDSKVGIEQWRQHDNEVRPLPGTVKLAFVERAGTRDRDLSSSQAAIVTASQMRKERPRSSR